MCIYISAESLHNFGLSTNISNIYKQKCINSLDCFSKKQNLHLQVFNVYGIYLFILFMNC
jgi:hypothetical protein